MELILSKLSMLENNEEQLSQWIDSISEPQIDLYSNGSPSSMDVIYKKKFSTMSLDSQCLSVIPEEEKKNECSEIEIESPDVKLESKHSIWTETTIDE